MPRVARSGRSIPRLSLRSRTETELGAHVTGIRSFADGFGAALGDGTVRLGSPLSAVISSASLHSGAILCACTTPDHTSFLTGGDDGKLCRLTASGQEVVLQGSKWVAAVAAHPSSAIACASGNKTIIRHASGRIVEWQGKGSVCEIAATRAGFAFASVGCESAAGSRRRKYGL